jgi:hypothetical protein
MFIVSVQIKTILIATVLTCITLFSVPAHFVTAGPWHVDRKADSGNIHSGDGRFLRKSKNKSEDKVALHMGRRQGGLQIVIRLNKIGLHPLG